MAGIRQWFHGLTSAVVSGSFARTPSAAVATMPTPAQSSACWMPARAATAPQTALPAASPPWNTSMNTASTRARTQSGARLCISALTSEMKTIHAAPAISIAPASASIARRKPAAIAIRPSITTPADATASVDQRARAGGSVNAPTTAPPPKHPRRTPYPVGLSVIARATDGSSASSALAKNIVNPARSIMPRSAGE